MKLVIYDKCWDAILELPRKVQKKVPEFIQKFREDSKSRAIHLEPISTFKDNNLRTARIDKKYRAIVHAPDSGDVYHLLWIDNHDEAMDWAKNKMFQWNINTQSFQVFTAPESIAEEVARETKEPAAEDKTGPLAAYTDEDLVKIGVPEILLPSVRHLENMGDLERLEKYLPVEAFENLFYLFDGEPIESIIEEVEAGKMATEDAVAQTQSPNNQRSFFELTDDDLLNEMLSGELQKWKIFLHPSQRSIVEKNLKGSFKVTGGAGTGKTVAAIHRANYLLKNDLGRNGKPIFFTTFTKALTNNLRTEFPEIDGDRTAIVLNNIDAFAYEQATKLGLIPPNAKVVGYAGMKKAEQFWDEVLDYELSPYDSHFLAREWNDVILFNNVKTDKEYFKTPRRGQRVRISRKDKMDIWRLCQLYQEKKKEQHYVDPYEICNLLYDHYQQQADKPFGHIIADEIQDFSNVELRLLRAMVDEKPNDLFLVGDPLQKIYQRQINFGKAGINIRGKRSRRLKINYRTTEEIKRAALSTIKNEPFDNFDGEEERKNGYVSLRHGAMPNYETFRQKSEELDFIIEKIYEYTNPNQANHFDLSDICIAARTRNSVKDATNRIHTEGLTYCDMTRDDRKGDLGAGIRLSTFHNMKGLEFKVVFLIDVNKRTLPFRPSSYDNWDAGKKAEYNKSELSLSYVAMTRAIHILHVTGVGERSGLVGF